MLITPEQIARQGSEDAHQMALFCWVAHQLAEKRYLELVLLHHIPNGGSRNKAEASKLRAMGVKSGVLDLFLPVPRDKFPGLYIEMKKPELSATSNGGLSPQQIGFKQAVEAQGYLVEVCYSWLEARDALMRYLGYILHA